MWRAASEARLTLAIIPCIMSQTPGDTFVVGHIVLLEETTAAVLCCCHAAGGLARTRPLFCNNRCVNNRFRCVVRVKVRFTRGAGPKVSQLNSVAHLTCG